MNIGDLIGGGKIVVADDNFLSTGVWNKPADLDGTELAEISLWSGGTGGNATSSATGYGAGGATGLFLQITVPLWMLPASATATVGAGGSAGLAAGGVSPTSGGESSFCGFSVPGNPPTSGVQGNGNQVANTSKDLPAGYYEHQANVSAYSHGVRGANGDVDGGPGGALGARYAPGAGAGGSSTATPKVGGAAALAGGSGKGGNGASSTTPAQAGAQPGGGGGGGRGNALPYSSGAAGGAGRIRVRVLR